MHACNGTRTSDASAHMQVHGRRAMQRRAAPCPPPTTTSPAAHTDTLAQEAGCCVHFACVSLHATCTRACTHRALLLLGQFLPLHLRSPPFLAAFLGLHAQAQGRPRGGGGANSSRVPSNSLPSSPPAKHLHGPIRRSSAQPNRLGRLPKGTALSHLDKLLGPGIAIALAHRTVVSARLPWPVCCPCRTRSKCKLVHHGHGNRRASQPS